METMNVLAIAEDMKKGYTVSSDNRIRKKDKYILEIENEIQNILFNLECLSYELYISKELGIIFPVRKK